MTAIINATRPFAHAVLVTAVLLFLSVLASGENNIWHTLFIEKLEEATHGKSAAQYDVGAMYQSGRGIEPDRIKAIEWYERAAAQNNQNAISRLTLMKSNEARFNKERLTAETGDAESQYNLGNMYTKGVGVNIDPTLARFWFEKAAEQGHTKSEYKLGKIYFETADTNEDRKTAFKWLASAAQWGYPPAQYYLGKMYAAGYGVTKDNTEALRWFRRAAEGGFNQARREIIEVSQELDNSRSAEKKTTHKSKRKSTQGQTIHNHESISVPGLKESGSVSEIMQHLMASTWNRNGEPVAWFPSAVSSCQASGEQIICNTGTLIRHSDASRVEYKTRSIVSDFSAEGSFQVVYRNLIIDAHETDRGLEAWETNQDLAIKTGWSREKILQCYLKNSTKIACLKNKTHNFEMVSHPKIAGSDQQHPGPR